MKISIIGAGNVGGLAAMRLAQMEAGSIFLIDIAQGLAEGKAFDLEDARSILKSNYNINGSSDIADIRGSQIAVVTAGLARKPGMAREDLLNKNAAILTEVCLNIKKYAPQAVVIIVTNPLDIMTMLAWEITGFPRSKILGMGLTLDASRFANLVAKELNLAVPEIEACVVSSHGEGMMPLARFCKVKGLALGEFMDEDKIKELVNKTVDRGRQIVSLLGSGSAYFAPSAAIAEIAKVIIKDEKRTLGVSACLNGEYGIKNICIGVPCRLGKNGIEKIIELKLTSQELKLLKDSSLKIKQQYQSIRHGL